MMKINILFEDQDILVVNKPAGLVVNRAGTVNEPTLQDWLEERRVGFEKKDWEGLVPADFNEEFGTVEEIFAQRAGLVHRLDKDTSGALVLAKNPGALVNLLAQFKEREVSKKYTCLTHNKIRVPEGTISAPLGRMSANRQKFAVVPSGRMAVTKYKVKEFYGGLNEQGRTQLKEFKKKLSLYHGFSLVECWPQTGRTHQIRVHMKHWGNPLVGDSKYVGKKRARLDSVWCPRQFLHAAELGFIHPRSGVEVSFTAELADDLKNALSLLD